MSEQLSAPIDLHTHSNYSDGDLTPHDLLKRAAAHGVAALAITDHDTVAAYADATVYAQADSLGVTLVPGVEISTTDERKRRFHVLGLDIDPQSKPLADWLEHLQQSRHNYTAQIVARMRRAGWVVEGFDAADGASIPTKAHIAAAVVHNKQNATRLTERFGILPDRGTFIETYMNTGQEFYVPRVSPSPKDAIDVIHAAGGIAALAHPVAYLFEQSMSVNDVRELLGSHDFDGIEALYTYFHKSGGDKRIDMMKEFSAMASELGLLAIGGSDFHSDRPEMGGFVDIGYSGVSTYPTVTTLQSVQRQAQARRIA